MKLNLVFLLFTLPAWGARAQEKVLVAAASDLRFALDSIVSVFKVTNSGRIDVSYGSSGKLSEQIGNGAPFHLFLSADIAFPQHLSSKGKTSSEIYAYAKGRIVIWSRRVDCEKKGMLALTDAAVKKIAIANPQHAPYGQRAVESMKYHGILEKVEKKIVYGENISQTAQFVSSGAADIGIIALSLARSPNMKRGEGKFCLIPEESHQPLIQGAVVTSHGINNKLALSFFEFIKSETATGILTHFGFSRP